MRIFAAFRHFNWEEHNLTPALRTFGDVVRYDWHPPYNQYDLGWHYGLKGAMNREMLNRMAHAHQEARLDVFYGYLSGRLVFRGTIEALRLLGIPTLNMTLDDKTHRYSNLEPTGFAGMVDIASAFDLCWTSDPTALEWYAEHGARAIYLPAGANPDVFTPRDCERDLDVVFVGKCYGRRESLLYHLQAAGVNVHVYGEGWERSALQHTHGPVSTEAMVTLMQRAAITLGIGEAAGGVLSLKGRDFEAPMAGAFYLTQHNPELADHYTIGEHLVTWTDTTDLIDKCRHYLRERAECERIRHNAAQWARAHHTWRRRFEVAFGELGVL